MGKFTIEFGPRSAERLDELARLLEISRAEVIRRALEHYDDYVTQREEQRTSARATAQIGEAARV
jgi:predicted transcriptional regulator